LSEPFLAVVVPAYNEESRIVPTLERLAQYLGACHYTWSVTVVSDGSTDSTNDLVAEFASTHTEFALKAYEPNRGKGYAVRTGMLEAKGEVLLFMDADMATPIEELEKLLAAHRGGADVAIGSRPLRESRLEVRQPLYRELLGRTFNKAVQLLAIRGISDTQCGFKLFTAKAASEVFTRCRLDGFSFDFEALIVARDLGFRIDEVPIRWAHQEGSKVVLLRDGPRMLLDLVKLRMRGRKSRLGNSAH
jgi:dolichyl-phosphate beta-glucosyltransferase